MAGVRAAAGGAGAGPAEGAAAGRRGPSPGRRGPRCGRAHAPVARPRTSRSRLWRSPTARLARAGCRGGPARLRAERRHRDRRRPAPPRPRCPQAPPRPARRRRPTVRWRSCSPGLVTILGGDAACASPWRHDGHPDHGATGFARRGGGVSPHRCPPGGVPRCGPGTSGPPPASGCRRPISGGSRAVRLRSGGEGGGHRRVRPADQPHPDAPDDPVVLPPAVLDRFRRPSRPSSSVRPGDHGLRLLRRPDVPDDPDPWGFETSAYERRKYALTMSSLPRRPVPRAFEPGCSIGVLTRAARRRADAVVATDIHPRPGGGRHEPRLAGRRRREHPVEERQPRSGATGPPAPSTSSCSARSPTTSRRRRARAV